MSSKATPSAEKAKTPAETAKPYGTAAKAAASKTASKAVTTNPDSSATEVAQQDTVKAIEKLEIRTKAVYVFCNETRGHASGLANGRSNANNIARVANSQLTANDEKLHPFMSLKTGKPIEKFPATSKEIPKLGCDRSGNEEAKREKLRLQIGLKPNPA
ncbi:hypothetical protein LTR86_003768 [Recurvomyces mirabilis]|nr:hypothetical protein LTR86_003768 [Recurvomyces mirabilis]